MQEAWFLYTPVVFALLIGVATDLEQLGQQSADRTTKFAGDAVAALDCAYTATPLTNCAPDLFNHDVSEEIEQVNLILSDLVAQRAVYSTPKEQEPQ